MLETAPSAEVVQRESGLRRELKPHQVAMIGLGCTIGTGLFLGSAIGVRETLLLAGIGSVLPVAWVLWSPVRTLRVMPDGPATAGVAETLVH